MPIDYLALVLRLLHILAVITAVGGMIFIRFALLPALDTIGDEQRRAELGGSGDAGGRRREPAGLARARVHMHCAELRGCSCAQEPHYGCLMNLEDKRWHGLP